MAYLPLVYLILLSPEEYYNNKIQWTNGYQPISQSFAAKKFDGRNNIEHPQIYLPQYHFVPIISGPVVPGDPPDKGKKDEEKNDENEMMKEDESGEMTTMRNDDEDSKDVEAVDYRTSGWASFVSRCKDGFIADENGNCVKGISFGEKEVSLDRKKRADVQNASKDRMIFKLSKKISVRDKRSTDDTKSREFQSVAFSVCKPGYTFDPSGQCRRTLDLSRNSATGKTRKSFDLETVKNQSKKVFKKSKKRMVRKKRSAEERNPRSIPLRPPPCWRRDVYGDCIPSTPLSSNSSKFRNEIFKFLNRNRTAAESTREISQNSNGMSGTPVRNKKSAEERKLSYADIVKYGRKGPPSPKPIEPKNLSNQSSTLKTSTTTPKPLAPSASPPLSKPGAAKPTKAPPTIMDILKPTPAANPKPLMGSTPKSRAEDPSLKLINSERNPGPEKNSNSKQNGTLSSNSPETTTSNPQTLHLVFSFCANGYREDEKGICQKAITPIEDKTPNLDRRKRDTDYNSELFRRWASELERNRQGRISDDHVVFQRREKKIENDTRKTEPLQTSRTIASNKSSQDTKETSDKVPSDEKNAASDGFGYISKECSKLVPGLVSDGAGGCTKAVKVKEKILQLERKKRQARTAFINFIDPNNRLRKNNFTITITIKGLNKQLNFTSETQDQPNPIDGGDKAVADNGFGVTSSKCDNLVPGLVPDGVGGCTKAITTFKKRNKFSFIVRNVENSQPIIDLDYENPEPELVSINPGDDDDPDADII